MTLYDKLEGLFAGRRKPADLCAQAGRLRAAGDSAGALLRYQRAIDSDPHCVPALHGAGLIALEQGRLPDAIGLLRSAAGLQPGDLQLHYDLAEALRLAGDWATALDAFRLVLAGKPDIAGGQLGLLECLVRTGQWDAARAAAGTVNADAAATARARGLLAELALQAGDLQGAERQVHSALAIDPADAQIRRLQARILIAQSRLDEAGVLLAPLLDPADDDAHGLAVQLCAARAGMDASPDAELTPEPPPAAAPAIIGRPEISIIICSVDPRKYAAVLRNYRGLLAGERVEFIGIHDARSLCEGYNRGLRQAAGELIVYSHDDVEVLTPDFGTRLKRHLRQHDVVGACGASRLVLGHWMSAGWPYLHGLVAHHYGPGHEHAGWYRVLVMDKSGEDSTGQLQGLDGMFIAARREVAERCRFDEETFDGFHLYDLDFTFSAYLAGYDVAVFRDITMVHYTYGQSPGYEAEFTRYRLLFESKYRSDLATPKADRRRYIPAMFRTRQQIRAFCEDLLAFRRAAAASRQ